MIDIQMNVVFILKASKYLQQCSRLLFKHCCYTTVSETFKVPNSNVFATWVVQEDNNDKLHTIYIEACLYSRSALSVNCSRKAGSCNRSSV